MSPSTPPNPNVPSADAKTSRSTTRGPASSARGCWVAFSIASLLVVATFFGGLLLIDKMNKGTRLKNAFSALLGKPLPAPPPVVKIVEKEVPVEKIVEKIVEVPPPLPPEFVPWSRIDTAKLWNGARVENSVNAPQGDHAAVEREKPDAIQIEMKLSFKIPKAAQSLEALEKSNPLLPRILPRLGSLVASAKVSPFFHHLYENKTAQMQQNLTRFERILSVHNFYDTETVLEMEDPESGQKVLFIQSDMDVVSDGSDGDRWPFLDNYVSMSPYYQATTSYGWPKRTSTPNPMLEKLEIELLEKKQRFAVKGLGVEENRILRARINELEPLVADLKVRSYLIAEADPFIVMSLAFLGRRNENSFGPVIGDYAVVIFNDKIYPAIIGDAGPSFKLGEASLRLAREINEKASPYSRPVSDLAVTYLVFPNSREPENGPPDLQKWGQRCAEFLARIGGLGEGYALHQWEDIIPVKLDAWKRANDPNYLLEQMKKTPAASESTPAPNPPSSPSAPPASTSVVPFPPAEVGGAAVPAPDSIPQPSFSNPVKATDPASANP